MYRGNREKTVLRLVVEAYVETGAPVGSTLVAKRQTDERMSPATVRTVMAELTKQGLLRQPHKNSGRVPSEAGLRCYLNRSLNPRLHPWDRTQLEATAQGADRSVFPTLLGQRLAGLSKQMSVVGVPRFVGSTFREVGLARCGAGRFVAFFVSPGGSVQQRMVQVEFDLSAEELARVQNFLASRLTNKTLAEVRSALRKELSNEEVERDRLLRTAVEIGLRALPEPELELVVMGAEYLADKPQFADLSKLRSLINAVETKTVLLNLLDRFIDGADVAVVLGSEHAVSEVSDLACVGGTCTSPAGSHAATISLMGPACMDYGRLVPLVHHARVVFERYWKQF